MTTCKSCHHQHEESRDVWTCKWCVVQVCDRCYSEHTDQVHFKHLSPDLYRRREAEKKRRAGGMCGEESGLDHGAGLGSACCELPGHSGLHVVRDQLGGEVYRWERSTD